MAAAVASGRVEGFRFSPVQRAAEKKVPQWTSCPQVSIHVYDLGHTHFVQRLNSASRRVALFHSGVEVYGVEWHFGFCWDESAPGVTSVLPRSNEEHTYRESIAMGTTSLSRPEVQEILVKLRKKWLGC